MKERITSMEEKIEDRVSAMEDTMNDMKSLCFPLVLMSIIKVSGVYDIRHISVVSPDKLWVSDPWKLQQLDGTGHVIRTLDNKYEYNSDDGGHTVSIEEDLVFIARVDDGVHSTASSGLSIQFGIHKMTSDGNTTTLLRSPDLLPKCIHSSHINGDLLIGLSSYSYPRGEGQVMRCDNTGKKVKVIEFDEEGQRLYKGPRNITENRINGDIVVSDEEKNALVVVDRSGRHRFDYPGNSTDISFHPHGVCTDLLGRILVSHSGTDRDWKNVSYISLLDQDGRFLTRLLKEQDDELTSLYVDDNYNIYVAYDEIIKVFR